MLDCAELLNPNKIILNAKICVSDDGSQIQPEQVPPNNVARNFIANHPFIYYIRHVKTNMIVLSGVFN